MKKFKEEWKQVPGYERYLVSNTGRVISTARGKAKELKAQQDAIGYVHFRLYPADRRFGTYGPGRGVKPKLFKGHRLVAETFIANADTTLQINHLDGNKHNNRVTNLEFCTAHHNIQHSWDSGMRKHTSEKIAIHNRRPLVAIHIDGIERYFESRNHLMFGIGCSRGLISRVLKNGETIAKGPAKGYTFVSIPELPVGESFETVDNFAEISKAYNDKYFGRYRAKRKNKK